MRALVFADFGRVELDDVARPTIEEPGDALLRVTTTAICGSDLHVLNGRIPGMTPGSTLGHEFIGVIEEVGPEVTRFKAGDRVLASFMIPCGRCWYCERRHFGRCPDQRVFGYGAFLGDVNGGQADYVRIPNADIALHKVEPALSDEQILFAGDIFTTGLEVAGAAHIEQGDSVVVIGCGPVGLMAIQAAMSFRPAVVYAVDTVAQRLAMAERFGATPVNAGETHPPTYIQERTGDRGADAVLDRVGLVPALLDAIDVVRPGGHIAVIGVHSDPEMEFPLNISFVKGIDLKFCGTANIIGGWERAFELIRNGTVQPAAIISHRLTLDEAVTGYELFEARQAMKVILAP